jgi:hypothetical protein
MSMSDRSNQPSIAIAFLPNNASVLFDVFLIRTVIECQSPELISRFGLT